MHTSGDADTVRGDSNSIFQIKCPDECVAVLRCTLALLQEVLSFDRPGFAITVEEVSHLANVEASSGANSDVGANLVVSRETFSIHYKGRTCPIGNVRAFALIERLNQRPGVYVTVDNLMKSICGSDAVEAETIQKHVSNLRKLLQKNGMQGITIDGKERGHYRLLLS